jgi:parallel beta-helix repeat protein
MCINLKNKIFLLTVIGLLILISIPQNIVATTIDIDNIKKPSTTLFGNTLYVGGSGNGNYSSIQDAIDNASDGDTVFVYDDSSPYYEIVTVDKSIQLIGENRKTTIIDGMNKADTNIVKIIADNVKLSGFTFKNMTRADNQGVRIVDGNENIITNNIFTNNYCAFYIFPTGEKVSNKNIISYNFIKDAGFHGIAIGNSSENLITRNIVQYCVLDNQYGGGDCYIFW